MNRNISSHGIEIVLSECSSLGIRKVNTLRPEKKMIKILQTRILSGFSKFSGVVQAMARPRTSAKPLLLEPNFNCWPSSLMPQ